MIKSNSFALKKLLFGLLAFVSLFAAEYAVVEATSRFLSQGLIEWLPVVLLVVGLAAIINFLVNLILSRRFNAAQSLMLSLLILMALTALTFYCRDWPVYYVVITLIVARLSYIVFDTALNNLSGTYVNARLAKTLLPFTRGVVDFAVIVASVTLFFVSFRKLDIDPLWILIGAITLMILLILVIEKLFEPSGLAEKGAKIPFKENIKESLHFIYEDSKLFRQLSWLFVALGGISVTVVYVYNDIFAHYFSGEALTGFIAVLNFIAVGCRGVFDLFLLRKTIYRFGVANMLLIYPWVMFLIVFALLAFSGNIYLAAAIFIFNTFSYYSYITVVTQSMFGLVPRRYNQAVYFLIKGVIPAICVLLGAGGVLLLNYLFGGNTVVIVALLLLLTGYTFIVAVRIKHQYQKVLLEALNGADLYLKGSAVELAGEKLQKNKAEIVLREMALNEQLAPELRRKVLTSLVDIGNPNSVRELLIIIDKEKNTRLRFHALQATNLLLEKVKKRDWDNLTVTKLLMIDVFNKAYQEDLPIAVKIEINNALRIFGFDVLLDFYKRHFSNSIDLIKASIIEAMSVANDRGLITLLEPYLDSHDLGIKAAAIAGLWRFEEKRPRLHEEMMTIFSGKDTAHRIAALKLISQMKMKKMDDYVLDLIAVPDEKVSTLAIITAINLGRTGAIKVLGRKVRKAVLRGDDDLIEYIFGKFYLFDKANQRRFINEIKGMNSPDFEMVRDVFNKSEKYFDLALTNLFTVD